LKKLVTELKVEPSLASRLWNILVRELVGGWPYEEVTIPRSKLLELSEDRFRDFRAVGKTQLALFRQFRGKLRGE
jgi:hypothetical protein